jgi:hypothetical protein
MQAQGPGFRKPHCISVTRVPCVGYLVLAIELEVNLALKNRESEMLCGLFHGPALAGLGNFFPLNYLFIQGYIFII